ncbi:PIN domain-containing protein [Reichenbachiella ulvae]|uniref:PIN domain-containing protein n=1 Tax=Reichenbachiella ulvae TaxID=2980104 RepID=A0ABT3CXT0_9BACT|nr:PIN domain-containing protein [Reichenbachiella ulvae]MCV9388381.1 PIN domain-containing protein [Reichenbachiella ulvae]
MKVIVDTNIVFSAILNTNGKIAQILSEPNVTFLSPSYLLTELVEHQNKLIKLLKSDQTKLTELKQLVIRNIHFLPEEQISPQHWIRAEELTLDVDHDDIAFVALALEQDCPIWTGDKKLRKGIKQVVMLDTNEIVELITNQ